ncbi:hypothetical protein [Accumulibacter sp.]|uniref:hypothetical protein n=1 Tax=Accumulibacter sp. TaxID=2053492 RepID=UPI002607DEC8|nr:hypothetical protein [Accumulibacter sp.]
MSGVDTPTTGGAQYSPSFSRGTPKGAKFGERWRVGDGWRRAEELLLQSEAYQFHTPDGWFDFGIKLSDNHSPCKKAWEIIHFDDCS